MYEYENEDQQQQPFSEAFELRKRKQFSSREVGLNHPDNKAFVKLADSGEIEIFAAPGVGIVINPSTRSISFFADTIKFYSKEDDGLRWNNMSFNPSSDTYNEPALIKTNAFANNPAFYNTNYYLNNLDNLLEEEGINPVTIGGRYGLGDNVLAQPDLGTDQKGITAEQQLLIDDFAKTNAQSDVERLIEFLQAGYTFSDAIEKIENEDYEISDDLEDFPWIEDDLENFPWIEDE
jgi:hypothetical protein